MLNGKFEDEYFIAKLLSAKQIEEKGVLLFKEAAYKDENFGIRCCQKNRMVTE